MKLKAGPTKYIFISRRSIQENRRRRQVSPDARLEPVYLVAVQHSEHKTDFYNATEIKPAKLKLEASFSIERPAFLPTARPGYPHDPLENANVWAETADELNIVLPEEAP